MTWFVVWYADAMARRLKRKKEILMKLLKHNHITQTALSMSKSDLSEMINNREDCELWIYSILAKRFTHLINQGLRDGWLELKGEYVRVTF